MIENLGGEAELFSLKCICVVLYLDICKSTWRHQGTYKMAVYL